MAGWGVLFWTGQDAPKPKPVSVVEATDLTVIEENQCAALLENARDKRHDPLPVIAENMICAFAPHKSGCKGDSGGPLVTKEVASGRYTLIGVVSWGNGDCPDGSPAVYARVTSALTWIRSNTLDASICVPSV